MSKSIEQMAKKILSILVVPVFMFVSAIATAETYYFHNDQLGTPQVVTDNTQRVVWKGEYDPFGGCTETINLVVQNIRFPGQYFDEETGLHYNYFRTYDPSTGRYVESDPIGLAGGLGTYIYVLNNPLIYSDIYGLSARDVQLIEATFNQYVKDATNLGHRRSPGFMNNISRTLYDSTFGYVGSYYKGCWEQADDLRYRLEELQLDDKWDFSRIDRGWSPTPHSWIEGKSNNRNDPHVTADPWKYRFVLEYAMEQSSDD